MKRFLIITVVILAIALAAYLVYKRVAKPVEETDVANTTTISQTELTTSARPSSSEDIKPVDAEVVEIAKKINSRG